MNTSTITSQALLVLTMIFATACGMPGYQLNKEERQADLEWVFSTLKSNYAPLDYKTKRHNIDFSSLKAECLKRSDELSQNETTNEEFRALVYECVSKLQDAHTSGSQMGLLVPGKARVAYLGFKTIRTKVTPPNSTDEVDALIVKELLPTEKGPAYPIQVKDIILKEDGVNISEVLRRDLIGPRDLGQESSSLTLAAAEYALRDSMNKRLPKAESVTLSILRDGKPLEVKMAWLIQDRFEFMKAQEAAKPKPAPSAEASEDEASNITKAILAGAPKVLGEIFEIFGTQKPELQSLKINKLELLLKHSFSFFHQNQLMYLLNPIQADFKSVKAERAINEESIVADLSVEPFPAYVLKNLDNGQLVGYVRVSSFGLDSSNVKTFAKFISTFNSLKVSGVIVDLIDNGGGSLVEGLQMAELMTTKAFEFPSIQFGLNNNWMESFERQAYLASSEQQKAMAMKVFTDLSQQRSTGKRLAEPVSTATLFPYFRSQTGAMEKLKDGIKVTVLVNEMCASMCDIFAAVMRDNRIGEILGTKSMGAGGNVAMHGSSPSSYFLLNTTESLLVNKDGSYLENNGVEPTIPFDTVKDRQELYKDTLARAIKVSSQP
jgi:hypothetical protein